MKRTILLAAAVALFAGAAAAQTPYVITNGTEAGKFTVKKNNTVVAQNVSQDSAINAIRRGVIGDPVTIQLGDTITKPLDMGSSSLRFYYWDNDEDRSYNFTRLTLTGAIKSTNSNSLSFSGVSSDTVDLEINASVEGGGIYVNSGYRVAITGGSYTLAAGSKYHYFYGVGVTITGGEFKKETTESYIGSYMIYSSNCDLAISGGKFEAAKNGYVLGATSGKLSISDSAELVSDTAGYSTVSVSGKIAAAVSGGKITNGATGGTAVSIASNTADLSLSGAPDITGAISTRYPGRITAAASFNPGTKKYTLDLGGSALDNGAVAVHGGGARLASFVYTHDTYSLAAKDGNIVVTLPATFTAPRYVITGNDTDGFLAKRTGRDTVGAGTMAVVIDSIRVDARALPCSLQFGNGTAFLDVGEQRPSLNGGAGNGWGKITLLGKLSGIASSNQGGPMPLIGTTNVTIDNLADIKPDSFAPYSLRLTGNTTFTHKSGNISGTVFIGDDGTFTLTGGKVGSIDLMNGSAKAAISGGTVGDSARTYSTVSNLNNGEVTISGGTVISANSDTLSGTIKSTGTSSKVIITGGTVVNVGKGNVIYSKTGVNGYVDISGGKILMPNDSGLSAIRTELSGVELDTGTFVTLLYVSGTAEVTSAGYYNIYATGNYSRNYDYDGGGMGAMVKGSVVEISGGKITSTRKGPPGHAVYIDGIRAIISGTAELAARNDNTGFNSSNPYGVIQGYNNCEIQILGGKITALPDSGYNPVAVSYGGIYKGPSLSSSISAVILGGSPEINGFIANNDVGSPVMAITTGASALKPGNKVYKVAALSSLADTSKLLVKNGAAFAANFAMVSASAYDTANNKAYRIAANGNDLFATKAQTYRVTFDLVGGKGTAPAAIPVIENGTLGELAKPATEGYVIVKADGKSYKNDGKWWPATGQLGNGEWIYGNSEFKFGIGNDGKKVTDDMTLLLKWTSEVAVSVLANDRVIPTAPAAEVTAITPVKITGGEVTAGPNPLAKRSDRVAFFWNGAPLKGGKLLVFDAAGNIINKVTVSDPGARGRRAVASWNLTDYRGRPVAEGVYAAKGVIETGPGKAEKVSVLISVR